ncbi:thioredoxin domain-containing protein [Meiothermus sp. QL-1]|uniref:thioredoxin domain-containing protein n=1 Tax=Meiothermus sp. QL-1 TaxID=2058095 RepID=UPI000E0A348D|nr:thioredoxin domain-containing protein [Meiothermus sp. QL-1]RDI96583.1 thioredoxin domain-containing protein [Meiothermus sp. QL-1]
MPNRLIHETSPYLLQHAHNPVDWYPWGEEAFAKARAEHKPIFLSVGYATCHWCHVMERESFEDPEIAQMLNAHFVPIKVDREERPDVDQVYMTALQAMTGSGGWPMSMFLLPDLRPFFGGTYWPPEDRHGLPSFRRVLMGIHQAWLHQQKEVLENAEQLTAFLQGQLRPKAGPLPEGLHGEALARLLQAADPVHGGFGGAPKFPQAPLLLYLLSLAWLGHSPARSHLKLTLDRMAQGGLYDQVGGGFHRYAVDAIWRVPHFEKMLYDNAQLARLYAAASLFFGGEEGRFYRRIACETLEYALRELQGPGGGFYAAQDADSEGVEGRFYVWSLSEFREVLGAEAEAAARLFGVSEAGNWEGTNVLERRYPEAVLRQELGLGEAAYEAWVEEVRRRLFEARRRRVPPLTDDKVLADWNGLMLRALAEAGRWLEEPRYLEAARQNARFVLREMWQDGLLRHSWRQGRLRPQAYLSDQAHYGLGLLALFEATGEVEWLEAARRLAEAILGHFRETGGGFYDSLDDTLPVRAKDLHDGPYPSGTAAAAELLLRLSALYEEPGWAEEAMRAIELCAQNLLRYPLGHAALLQAHLVGSQGSELAVVLPSHLAGARRWFLPLTTLAFGPPGALPVLRGRQPGLAYLCRRGACRLPTEDEASLREELQALYPKSQPVS